MSDLFNQTMTIKQISEILGVSDEAIKKHVRELFPDLMEHGKITYLDSYQVTEIKKKMQQTTLVVSSKTELEIMEGGLQYMRWMQSKINEQKLALQEAQPKIEFYDTVADARGDRTIMDTGKLLGMTKPRKLYELLRNDGITMKNNEAYQKYIEQGYFRLILTVKNGVARSTTYVTDKGLAWIHKRYAPMQMKGLL